MERPTVSLVFASPVWSARTALGLAAARQQIYPDYEIVLSGPQTVLDGCSDAAMKRVLSSADTRAGLVNDGLAVASGELVALVDPEAVPEPYWLARLAQAMCDADIAAATGLSATDNGIGVRQRVEIWDGTGRKQNLQVPSGEAIALTPPAGRVLVPEGGNLMLRRDQLADIGGLDPQIPDPMSIVDLALRTGVPVAATAVVPTAVVHLPDDPVPDGRQLMEIGQGLAIVLRRHCAHDMHHRIHDACRTDIRANVVRRMLAGKLSPDQIPSILRQFDSGFDQGTGLVLRRNKPIPRSAEGFKSYHDDPLSRVQSMAAERPVVPESGCVCLERMPVRWPRPEALVFQSPGVWRHRERYARMRSNEDSENAVSSPVRNRFGA